MTGAWANNEIPDAILNRIVVDDGHTHYATMSSIDAQRVAQTPRIEIAKADADAAWVNRTHNVLGGRGGARSLQTKTKKRVARDLAALLLDKRRAALGVETQG